MPSDDPGPLWTAPQLRCHRFPVPTVIPECRWLSSSVFLQSPCTFPTWLTWIARSRCRAKPHRDDPRGWAKKPTWLKGAKRTYERLLLPGYRHSVPTQEALKEARWPDFRDGRWGNRENLPAPAGDVRPAPTKETPPAEEQATTAASGSALSQRSVTPSINSAGVSSRATLASGTLMIVIPTSEAEGSADEIEEMSVPASPLRLPISQDMATGSMTHAVTS